MFVHSVYFWLRSDLTAEERKRFVDGVHSLVEIQAVRHGYVGVPASTDRPIIDRSYSYALTLVFDDEAGHDAYQPDPAHQGFVESCKSYWSKILIYDSVTE